MRTLLGQLVPAVTALLWLTGCASIGAPLPPSLELPKAPSDLRAARKGDKVTLTWTIPERTTDRQRVRYLGKTLVCRGVEGAVVYLASLAGKDCGTPIGEASPPADFAARNKSSSAKKLTASFADALPSALEQANPTGFATYAVEVLNAAGRGAGTSNLVRVGLVPTLPPFGDFSAQVVSQGVFISWRCRSVPGTRRNEVKHLFRIYRRQDGGTTETKIGELGTPCIDGLHAGEAFVDLHPEKQGDFMASFVDQSFEWGKTYFYRSAVVSVVEMAGKPAVEIEGDDSPEVKVFAHDVFPPAVPSGLQAVYTGPGQQLFIDLIWAPVTDADLDGYNIYRHEEGGAAVQVNSEPVKVPAFRDAQVVSGKTYFYSVSAVDVRGNESARSEVASESVP